MKYITYEELVKNFDDIFDKPLEEPIYVIKDNKILSLLTPPNENIVTQKNIIQK